MKISDARLLAGSTGAACAALMALWAWFALVHAIPFWQTPGDYPWYALSQAFTIESLSAGKLARNAGFLVHPGIPFALLNWVALRASDLAGGHAERVMAALRDPEAFWLAARLLALALNLLGVLAYRLLFRERSTLFLVATACHFAFTPAVLGLSLLQFTIESFALPFLVGSYALAARLFQDFGEGREPSIGIAAVLGTMAAFGLSLKIYYLAPTVGVAVALAYAVITRSLRPARLLWMLVAAATAFTAVGVPLIVGMIGPIGLTYWLDWNLGMLSHAGRYGSGQAGFLDATAVADVLQTVIVQSSGTAVLVLLVVALLLAMGWRRRGHHSTGSIGTTLFAIAVMTGASLHLLGLLKHYLPHYAIPLGATIPCLLAALDVSRLPRVWLRSALAAALALLGLNVVNYAQSHHKQLAAARALQADVRQIEAMPVEAGRLRIWGYLSASMPGMAPLIVSYSGSPWIADVTLHAISRVEEAPMGARRSAVWGLVILPKVYFPDQAAIAGALKRQFDFARTDFRLCPSDTITELDRFLVVRPGPRESDGRCG